MRVWIDRANPDRKGWDWKFDFISIVFFGFRITIGPAFRVDIRRWK